MRMSLGHLADGIVDPLPQGCGEIAISGLTADSREVLPGFVFAALAGTTADGSRFIADAVSRGAAAVLGGRGTAVADSAVPLLQAANPRRALALMAARFFALQPSVAVAVTGTNGKTSVTSFVRDGVRRRQHGHRRSRLAFGQALTRPYHPRPRLPPSDVVGAR
jgi:UDP-N-acetylmuramyl tripeptide synthase